MHRFLKVSGALNTNSRALRVKSFATAKTAQATMPSPSISQKKAAVLGGFCADSATYPLHWIYDVGKVKELLKGKEDSPEFYPTPSCPFYNSGPVGVQSCYGDELIPLLKAMAENGGEFDAAKYTEALHEFYTSPNSYRNKSIRSFMAAYDEGKRGVACGDTTDSQANCFTKVPIIVAKYAGRPECMVKVEEAIRVQQNNEQAVRYGLAAAKIMEKVMLGDSIDNALAWAKDTPGALEPEMQQLVAKAVEAAKNPPKDLTFEPPAYMKGMMDKIVAEKDSLSPYTWAVWCHGPACGNPAALTNVLMTVAAFGGKAGSSGYVEAVRSNLLAAGDNASRTIFIGAMLAAANGSDAAIPEKWKRATKHFEEFEQWCSQVYA